MKSEGWLPAPESGRPRFNSFCHNSYQIRKTVRVLKNGLERFEMEGKETI